MAYRSAVKYGLLRVKSSARAGLTMRQETAAMDRVEVDQDDERGRPTEIGSYVFSDQVGYLLRRAYQRHLAIFQTRTSVAHLTAIQFSTLCALADAGALSQRELVRSTGVDQATIRGIVERLRQRGLISLSKDPHDARKVIIAITRSGLDVLDLMKPAAFQVTEETLGPLNPAERLALLFTLRKMADLDATD
jgi:MarR family transcriptional regulator, lower aerobic nicotinate degradation pathway regulator